VVENAFRDVNIAFANEVALACERMGVDAFEIRELINARPDRHMHIPGAGVGGHCLPKDSWLLKYGLETYGGGAEGPERGAGGKDGLRLIPLAREINDGMPEHMLALIEDALEEVDCVLEEAKVTLLGVAYLENADDTRNTPAATLAKLLQEQGAEVIAHDPHVRNADWQRALDDGVDVPLTDDLWAALEEADCVALVTRHQEYGKIDLERVQQVMRTAALVDGRNVCSSVDGMGGIVMRAIGRG
jgi:UDP-N-acetyl-D-mannosaminuronic acid dehydrogenase